MNILLFNDMISIKNFDPSLIKIDKKSYKNIGIYDIGYITIKRISDYENINSVNSLYLITSEVEGYIKENNENKYLAFASTEKKIKKCQKSTQIFWIKLNVISKQ